jgi:cell division protein FtsA
LFRKKSKIKPFITVLDIGTSKVCCLIVRFDSEEKPEVLGMGYAPAQGIKAGAIVDLEKATACIASVLAQAEKQAERQIDKVIVNISSTQLKSLYAYREIEIAEGKPITAGDVKRLVDDLIAAHMGSNDEIIHSFPLGYVVDKEQGSMDPRGLYGTLLGAHVHLTLLPESQLRNLVAVLDRCHVSIEMKVAAPYAAALSVLTEEEKEIGATCLDMGAGTTGICVFLGGGLVNLGIVPIGGNAVTRDIAQGLGASIATAERLKNLNGAAFLSPRDELERLIVPVLGEEEGSNVQLPRSDLISIIIPRIEEILEQVGRFLKKESRFNIATKRIVLTGGGSELQGIKEKTARELDASVRIGKPSAIKGMQGQYDAYTFSTCIGLLKYAMMKYKNLPMEKLVSTAPQKGLFGKVIEWLTQNF